MLSSDAASAALQFLHPNEKHFVGTTPLYDGLLKFAVEHLQYAICPRAKCHTSESGLCMKLASAVIYVLTSSMSVVIIARVKGLSSYQL